MPPLILTPGHASLMQPRRFDEVLAVVVVLLEAGGNGEHVGIEDDVRRIDAGLFGQQPIGALADLDLARDGVGLALLVEGHHDHRRRRSAGPCAPWRESRLRPPSG